MASSLLDCPWYFRLTSQVPAEGKSSVCVICFNCISAAEPLYNFNIAVTYDGSNSQKTYFSLPVNVVNVVHVSFKNRHRINAIQSTEITFDGVHQLWPGGFKTRLLGKSSHHLDQAAKRTRSSSSLELCPLPVGRRGIGCCVPILGHPSYTTIFCVTDSVFCLCDP